MFIMDPHLCKLLNQLTLTSAAEQSQNAEGGISGYIILLLVLIALNAYFAASELAIVSLRRISSGEYRI